MEKNYNERDEGENQDKKIDADNEQEYRQNELHEDQAAVLAWTACQLIRTGTRACAAQV